MGTSLYMSESREMSETYVPKVLKSLLTKIFQFEKVAKRTACEQIWVLNTLYALNTSSAVVRLNNPLFKK